MQNLKNSQNFLINKNLVRNLIVKSKLEKNDTVIEIGPGKGIITNLLEEYVGNVIAIEYDENLFRIVFSNIPFQITADIIKKITEYNNSAEEIFLIVQKEAAKKYCGIPYQKYEGLRAAVIKAQYHVEIMHTFNRSDFSPSPKVDTVLLHLKQKKNTLSLSEYKDFKDLVAYFYSQGKGKSSKDRLAVLFSNAQIRRLCKDNNINLLDSYTKITSEQWMNVFLYSRIGLTAEKKRLVGDAYKKLEKINKGLQKQNRTYLRKPSQSNSKSSTFNRRQKSLN